MIAGARRATLAFKAIGGGRNEDKGHDFGENSLCFLALRQLLKMTDAPARSRWFTVDQARIDAFAEVTEDHQFVHCNPVRAAREGPFDGTIAHGFLTLSLLSAMFLDAVPPVPEATAHLNLGFDKLRFLAPVPAGSRLRGAFILSSEDYGTPGQVTQTWSARVEIEDADAPALIARWRTRYQIDPAA